MGSEPADPERGRRRVERRHVVTGGWVLVTTLWGIGRIVVVAAALQRYGVNPWVFGLVELVTSPIEGYSTAHLARRLRSRDHHGATRWAAIAVVAYVMPDAYVFGSARQMPGRVFLVVLAFAVLLALVSLGLFIRSVRSDRNGPAEECEPDHGEPDVPPVTLSGTLHP